MFGQLLVLTASLVGLAASSGCASARPYISSNLDDPIEVSHSEVHELTYVRAYDDGDDLVIYGRVNHMHRFCPSEGHVDLVLIRQDGEVLERVSIPIVDRGTRRRGWFGAAFRARLTGHAAERASLRLAVHDERCFRQETFDCGSNRSLETSRDL